MNGNRSAAARFGGPESTVRSIVKAYNKEKSGKHEELMKLPKRPRGAKPLLPSEVDAKVNVYLIPPELVINIDHTPLRFYLTPTHTFRKKGEASVTITNSSDYRQITGTFGISRAGEFLLIQLIYQGKTNKCHPNYNFPKWLSHHSHA